jgi:threonine synthase
MAHYKLSCANCTYKEPETSYVVACPKCGGFLEVLFDSPPSLSTLSDSKYPSIFRFHRAMPFNPENLDTEHFETVEATPEISSEVVGSKLGIDLIYKNEMVLPTGTWKDREGFVSMHRLLLNKVSDLVLFSSGNSGSALARSAGLVRGPNLHLVIPKKSEQRLDSVKKFINPEYVRVHFFDGSNDECADHANALAKERGWASEGGFTNYARREGLKLLALEYLSGPTKKVDWYAQPVAGGIGIYSFFKAHKDIGLAKECPRILGVQAEICSPMVNAWREGSSTLETRHIPQEIVPSDFVRVLRTRNPKSGYSIVKKTLDEVNGAFESVSDREIYESLRLFYQEPYFRKQTKKKGIVVGLEPATALAGVVKAVKSGLIRKGERVLLNVSGAAKAGDIKTEWISDLL